MTNLWDDAPVVHAYTRAEAIEDGFLVDVTETAREAGFRVPVAVTRGVWAEAVEWDADNRAPKTKGDGCGTCSGWPGWRHVLAAATTG